MLLAGIFSLIYGIYSYKKESIVIPKHNKLFNNWWNKPYWILKGNKAKNVSLLFILLGILIFVNLFFISTGLITI